MLLLVAVLGFLLYQCYNKPSACAREGFAAPGCGKVKLETAIPSNHEKITDDELAQLYKDFNELYKKSNSITEIRKLIVNDCRILPKSYLFIDSNPPVIAKKI
jgi:hypothetical protein